MNNNINNTNYKIKIQEIYEKPITQFAPVFLDKTSLEKPQCGANKFLDLSAFY